MIGYGPRTGESAREHGIKRVGSGAAGLVLAAVLALPACASGDGENGVDAPEEGVERQARIEAGNQESDGGRITVDHAGIEGEAGFLAVYDDDRGQPGDLLGHAAVPAGGTDGLEVSFDPPIEVPTVVLLRLHVDEGETGRFEYPGPDAPVAVDGEILLIGIRVTSPDREDAGAAPEGGGQPEGIGGGRPDWAEGEAEEDTAPPVTGRVEVSDQDSDGTSLVVDAASLGNAEAGFVVVYAGEGGADDVLGSAPIGAGRSEAITVAFDRRVLESTTLVLRVHVDTHGDGVLQFPGPDRPVSDEATVRITVT